MVKRFFQMSKVNPISSFESNLLASLIQKTIELRGSQYPNPAVGAMVIKNNHVISEGFHLLYGHDHAEVVALKKAGSSAQGATLLITLEPCVHTGKTPPCVNAIINAGIQRVIWAINDPNPRVYGKAQMILEDKSIEVIPHYSPDAGLACLKEFHAYHQYDRPYVYVKAAVSLDGKIAPHSNGLTYISSPESLHVVQQLRQNVQAICVGASTINIDQPRLSIRIDQRNDFQPLIVILDPNNSVDLNWVHKTLGLGREILLFRSESMPSEMDGLTVLSNLTSDKQQNWQLVMKTLYEKKIHGLLVEGGSAVFRSILNAGYFDELWITKVPQVFGSDAVPFVSNGANLPLDISLTSSEIYGSDVVMKYQNNHAFSV